jgi:hypothetical protein
VAGWLGNTTIFSVCQELGSAEHKKKMQDGLDLEEKNWGGSVFGSRKPSATRVK